jgi:hypothetical protein
MPPPIRSLLCVFALSGAFLVGAHAASAGVIIWEEERFPSRNAYLIEIIQGHKEWLAWGYQPQHISHALGAIVYDLDHRVRTQIDYRRKVYYIEKPYPPEVGDEVNARYVGNFKPTGKFRKIAGYSCEEYVGTGDSAHWGHQTDVHCVSKDAPGLREYTEYMNLLNRLYEGACFVDGSYGQNFPSLGYLLGINGIILASGPDPDLGFVVTKIESTRVPESQFEVPAGYVRKPLGRAPDPR